MRMDMTPFLPEEGEEPLQRLVDDGGFTAIFRTIACIGDSLSSGEFESRDAEGNKGYHDMYEYSWGQYMARAAGCTVYNFSKGGMTAQEYMKSFGEARGFFDKEKAAQAYIFALGVNDLNFVAHDRYADGWGSMEDVTADWHEHKDSFYGCFAALVQRYKEIRPDGKFFFIAKPRNAEVDEAADKQAKAMYDMAEYFSNSYVIDLGKYGPITDGAFHDRFFLGGHMNPTGYILFAKMVMSYINYLVRHHFEDFVQVPFIGTEWTNPTAYPIKKKEN